MRMDPSEESYHVYCEIMGIIESHMGDAAYRDAQAAAYDITIKWETVLSRMIIAEHKLAEMTKHRDEWRRYCASVGSYGELYPEIRRPPNKLEWEE